MTPDKAPRRWWLDICTPHGDPCDFISEKPHDRPSSTNIEVIEASAYDAIAKERDDLERALAIESNSPWERTQEASQYNWMDDQFEKLEAQLQRERRKVEIALEALHDIKAHCRDRSIPQGMEYAKCLSVSASAILELEAIEKGKGE